MQSDMATEPEHFSGTPSIISAFGILDEIALADAPVNMADISRALDLPKSSVHRLLRALESVDAVVRRSVDKKYTLGPKLRHYGDLTKQPGIVEEFMDVVTPVANAINETMQFGVLTGRDVTFLASISSTQPVRLVSRVGRRLPAHATATGKAILAFSGERTIDEFLENDLLQVVTNTITDKSLFRAELALIRGRGFATESEESTLNLSCVAAPVLGPGSKPVGAVTVCVPVSRLSPERQAALASVVLEASYRLSAGESSRPEVAAFVGGAAQTS